MKHFDPLLTKKIYALWTNKFGMKRFTEGGLDCYVRNGKYYRLDTFYENDGELLYCVEIADSLDDAKINFFEDAFLYGEKLGHDEIITQMSTDLLRV